jgi:hypothetical protein
MVNREIFHRERRGITGKQFLGHFANKWKGFGTSKRCFAVAKGSYRAWEQQQIVLLRNGMVSHQKQRDIIYPENGDVQMIMDASWRERRVKVRTKECDRHTRVFLNVVETFTGFGYEGGESQSISPIIRFLVRMMRLEQGRVWMVVDELVVIMRIFISFVRIEFECWRNDAWIRRQNLKFPRLQLHAE